FRSDLWDAVAADERFDVVVSNPPYVAEAEAPTLAPEVREWEPGAALFAGADGLQVIQRIVDGAAAHLLPGGLLAIEVGLGQAGAVAARLDATRALESARIVQDLADRPRIASAVRRAADAAGSRNPTGAAHVASPVVSEGKPLMNEAMMEKARDLGRMIGQTDEYKALGRARQNLDSDREAVETLNRLAELEAEIASALRSGQEPSQEAQ